jgi:hypothetical protein
MRRSVRSALLSHKSASEGQGTVRSRRTGRVGGIERVVSFWSCWVRGGAQAAATPLLRSGS